VRVDWFRAEFEGSVTTSQESDPALAASAEGGGVLAPGTVIGEYCVEREIGRGGMGVVYAARHPVIDKRVAIKVLDFHFSHDPALVKRFTDEARAVNRIGHPNIIDVFSFGQLHDGRLYFVMEFLEGETLASWLAKGRPDPIEACRLLVQVCEALEAAHREGIIHRDLKPDNLWIAQPKHGQSFIKVLDFGIAKLTDADGQKGATKTGMIMGTPQFMSPEQCVGRGVDNRSDIYSLGAIAFCVYCGQPPFDGESAAEIIAHQLYRAPPRPSAIASVPPALDALILSCLDKDPANRPASAAELGTRLKDAVSSAGAVTAILAPAHVTGDAAAPTRSGYTSALATESVEPDRSAPRTTRRWPILAVVALALVSTLAIWLGRAPRHETSVRTVVAEPDRTEVAATGTKPPVRTTNLAAAAPLPDAAPPPSLHGGGLPPGPPDPRARRSFSTAARARSAVEGTAVPPPVTPPSVETKRPPSRAAREGLVQENPF
jgi:eukaryotic-like serine/threonine-protein kinase